MLLTPPINKCYHPVRIKKGGSWQQFNCDQCPACLKRKQSNWRNRLTHEINNSKASLFITLTYSNEHLPLVTYDKHSNEILMVSHSSFNRKGTVQYKLLTDSFIDKYPNFKNTFTNHLSTGYSSSKFFNPITKQYEYEDKTEITFPHYVESRINSVVTYNNSNTFAIVLRKDIQDFLKRLRTLLDRLDGYDNRDKSFRYFICSEYGPETFRPHYHGTLHFNDSTIASICHSSLIAQAWRKHDISKAEHFKISQWITTGKGCPAYVSKYVTCDANLPTALLSAPFKTFHVSSHATPIGSSAIDATAIGSAVRDTNLLYTQKYQDKDTGEFIVQQVSYPSSLWRRYFPQLLFARRISPSTISKLYQRIFDLPLYSDVPNYTSIFNRLYNIGLKKHIVSTATISPFEDINSITDDIFGKHPLSTKFNSYEAESITYSKVFNQIFCNNFSEADNIDLFLFGIPQNRSVVSKLLKLRAKLINSSDNWCKDYNTYLYHFNLFHSKTFSNQLKNFYENLSQHDIQEFTPQIIAEYYPSTFLSMPKELSSFCSYSFQQIESILNYRFNISILDFYTPQKVKISPNYNSLNRYSLYRTYVTASHRLFKTKRFANYHKFQDL